MYKTGAIKVKTQILETIFAELPQTAKKVKLSIKFDEEEKLNTFKRLEAEREEDEEENISIDSESESEEEDNNLQEEVKEKDANPIGKIVQTAKKQVVERLRHQKIDISLEEGIIYKQFYEKDFEKVSEAYGVKIKIRAQKVTFEGYDIEDIEDAMDEAKTLMDKIEVQYIPKYGLQMSESAMINKMLEKIGIKIFRILDKYYRWYEVDPKLSPDEQRKKKSDIKDVLRQIDSANHCLQYLSLIQKNVDVFKGSQINDFEKLKSKYMSYRPLLENLKGVIFEKEFKSKLNEESMNEEQIEVELGLSKDALVFHSVAKELLEMSIKDVKIMYQTYDYFFITIDSDNPINEAINILKEYEYDSVMQKSRLKPNIGEIEQVKEINYIHFTTNHEKVKTRIQNKLNDPAYCGDYVPKESVVFCIGFRRRVEEKKMEYLCEILEKLQLIWGGASYKISILLDQAQEIQDPKVSYEFNSNERIFCLAANETSIETNQSILRDYVIKRKIETKRIKQASLDPEQNNVSLSTINPNSVINESTVLHQKSISQDMNASAILDPLGTKGILGLVGSDIKEQPDEKSLKLLADYKVYIPETNKEYNEKYKETNVKEDTVVKVDKRNRTIEDDLTKITDCNFQVYKIQLNLKHKIDSYYQDPVKDQVVTVFLSSKISPFVKPKGIGLKIEQGMNESFPVKLLSKSKETILENGYLINIKKQNIFVDGKSFKVKYGEPFEVAKELVYLKK